MEERHAAGQSLPEGMGLSPQERSMRIEVTVATLDGSGDAALGWIVAVVHEQRRDGGVSAERHIGKVLYALA